MLNSTTFTPDAAVDALDRAELALAGGLVDEALDQVVAARRIAPDHPGARLLEARLHLLRCEPRQALRELEAATPQPQTRLMRVQALAATGELDEALELLQELTINFPADSALLRGRAGLEMKLGQSAAAAATLEQLVILDPHDAAAARLLSGLLAGTDADGGLRALGRITENNLRRAAALCHAAGRLREAEDHFARWLEEADLHGQVAAADWSAAAAVADELGDVSTARYRLGRALACEQVPPTERVAMLCRLARLHLITGETATAGRLFWSATRQHDEQPTQQDTTPTAIAWAGLLRCAQMFDRTELAAKAQARLADLTSRSERQVLLASLEADVVLAPRDEVFLMVQSPLQKMLDNAAGVLRLAAGRHPGRADVHYHRAACDLARGEAADADAWLDLALTINPTYAAARDLKTRLSCPALEPSLG